MAAFGDVPVGPLVRTESRVARDIQEGFLREMGLPQGISEQFLVSCQDFPLRIWIVDNSGSMQTADGHRIVSGPAGREGLVTCSRWEELGDALVWHTKVAAHLGAATEFRMLNPPGGGQPQVLQVGVGGDPEPQVQEMQRLIKSGPGGMTPLCEQIRCVIQRIKEQEKELREAGRRVCLIVASDGAASDGDIAKAMQPLRQLPVWVVIRLCTDDDSVVKYWNDVDEELELDMDVLDDLSGEAAEVTEDNPWLTYAAPLHRLREWGTCVKVMDNLDEKMLAPPEMRNMMGLLFGNYIMDMLPYPEVDWDGFERVLGEELTKFDLVWDPLRNRKCPWIDMKKLKRRYRGPTKKGDCVVS